MSADAETIARSAHAGHTYAGRPYADGHLALVVARVQHQAMLDIGHCEAAAWLHDVLEDTAITPWDLAAAGVSERVVVAVQSLTRQGDETYRGYIGRLCASGDRIALEVKRADLEVNIIQSGAEVSAQYEGMTRKRWLPALCQVLRALGHMMSVPLLESGGKDAK